MNPAICYQEKNYILIQIETAFFLLEQLPMGRF